MGRDVNRRDFVKGGVVTAGAVALGSASAGVAAESALRLNGLPTVTLPRGGDVIPLFGLGTGPLIPIYTKLPREDQVALLRHAYDMGVRYFDTAVAYRTESLVGDALADVRDQVYINTKVAAVEDPKGLPRIQIEQSLRNLKTDVIDCVKVHCPYDYDYGMTVADELEKLRAEGKIRRIGLSNHVYFQEALKMIDTGRFDEVLLAKGYFPKADFMLISQYNWEFMEACVARAHSLGMNVIGMKALGGTVLGRPSTNYVADYPEEKRRKVPGAAIRWAYSDPRFHLYVIGVGHREDVDETVPVFQGDMTVTDGDRAALAEFSVKLWESERIREMQAEIPFPSADAPRWISDGTRKAIERRKAMEGTS
jgi:predicted aldo/keto reductase-like oxidoreductase